jgi:hypothetical protein
MGIFVHAKTGNAVEIRQNGKPVCARRRSRTMRQMISGLEWFLIRRQRARVLLPQPVSRDHEILANLIEIWSISLAEQLPFTGLSAVSA